MSIVKELCKLLGGEISLESQVGRGSTFTVILPWIHPGQVGARADDMPAKEPTLDAGASATVELAVR